MSTHDIQKRWTDAINRRDLDAFLALYAPNAVLEDPQYAQPLEGRDAIGKDMVDFLRAFPDLQASTRSALSEGAILALDGTFTGTQTGPLITENGEIPPTGKRMQLKGAGIWRLDGQGRILEERRYYDLSSMFAQLELSVGGAS